MEHICSHCGCTSFHYNRARMRLECDMCGTPIEDSRAEQQLMQFDRIYAQAMSHLTAGNWQKTIGLLKPMLENYPTEKKLYLAILRAATQDFRDIDLKNESNRILASEMWNKLVRLNHVTAGMLAYSKRRYDKHQNELKKKRIQIIVCIFAAALCAVAAGIFFETEYYFLAIMFVNAIIGFLSLVFISHPVRVIRQLGNNAVNYRNNPFV